jgi:SOS-response transcriptional repressor LexA
MLENNYNTEYVEQLKLINSKTETNIDTFIATFIKNSNTTIIQIKNNIYKDMYIYKGDYIIVNDKTTPYNGCRVLISINNKLSIKKYRLIDGFSYIQGKNYNILPLNIGDMQCKVLGVITGVIHNNLE